jgi:hypothetical protein
VKGLATSRWRWDSGLPEKVSFFRGELGPRPTSSSGAWIEREGDTEKFSDAGESEGASKQSSFTIGTTGDTTSGIAPKLFVLRLFAFTEAIFSSFKVFFQKPSRTKNILVTFFALYCFFELYRRASGNIVSFKIDAA